MTGLMLEGAQDQVYLLLDYGLPNFMWRLKLLIIPICAGFNNELQIWLNLYQIL